MSLAVDMRGITKRFSKVLANDKVDLQVETGEIHAILGENGAGKSTLMNILYGLYQPDAGEVRINGELKSFRNSREAVQAGIGMVHQHFMLIPTLTVAQNIILGQEIEKNGLLAAKLADQVIKDLSKQHGLRVDPQAYVRDISVGIQQRVEILKILYRKAKIIVLDEPTAVLTPQEVGELYEILNNLKNSGHTIIFITHKIKEIKDISDRVTVLRDGRFIKTVKTKEVDHQELARLMVGRPVELVCHKDPPRIGGVVLAVNNLQAENERGTPALKGIDLVVRRGEIVGIAGVDGNGQTELIECLAGLRQPTCGTIKLCGQDITGCDPETAYKTGLGHIPEDRHKHGLILDFSLTQNLLMGNLGDKQFFKGPVIDYQKARKRITELIERYSIRAPHAEARAGGLSGGNQQKVIIAREIDKDPDLLIAAQPTRGVDVGAIEFIHRQLIEQRDKGKGILLVSMELDEIMQLCDRIYVMYDGCFVGEMDAADATTDNLGLLMAGVRE